MRAGRKLFSGGWRFRYLQDFQQKVFYAQAEENKKNIGP